MNEDMVESVNGLEIHDTTTEITEQLVFSKLTPPEEFPQTVTLAEVTESETLPAGEIVQTPTYNEADIAAAFFARQAPRLDTLLNKMSAKQLRRVIFNTCSYPLIDRKYNPRTQDERDVAFLVHEMVLNKNIMQLHFEMQKAEEDLQKKQEADKLAEEVGFGLDNNETKEEV